MVQRIQSVYLLLTTILSLLFLNSDIIRFISQSGSFINITLIGVIGQPVSMGQDPNVNILPLSVILIIIPIFSFITIFLFKKRKFQLILSKILIILIVVMILVLGIYSYQIISGFDAQVEWGYKMIIPLFLLIFSFLAYRGIKKDDILVQSYDRLR